MTLMPLKVWVLAGEASGDLLGGRLMAGLRELSARPVTFQGVGGPRMIEQGLDSLFPMAELSLFGVVEILPKLFRLQARIKQTVKAILDAHPDVVITIDSPGFNARVARAVRDKAPDIKLIHYVAPTVWAWKPYRARKYAALFDHLLAILPFEPPYFVQEGLHCTFVGHSVVESRAGRGDGAAFRARHGIKDDQRILVLLPGSRRGEIARLLPVFRETLEKLAESHGAGKLAVVLPTVPHVRELVAAGVAGWPLPVLLLDGEVEKFDAFAAGAVALAASGTVALELALSKLPAVITYRLHPLTLALYRRFIRVRYANLVNLMLDRMLVPELLQEDCRPDLVYREVSRLLDDPAASAAQIAGVATVAEWLGAGGVLPSRRAARVVLDVLGAAVNEPEKEAT